MALTGNEQVAVLGQGPTGGPASDTFVTTTQDIANLGGGGGITGSTWNLNDSGLAPSFDAQISVTGGSSFNALGELQATAMFTHFYTYDGTEQFRVGSQPLAGEWLEVRGGITGAGPLLYATSAVSTNDVNMSIICQGNGSFSIGNWFGTIVNIECAPGEYAYNQLKLLGRTSGQPVGIFFEGRDTDVSGYFGAQNAGGISFANGSGVICEFVNATGQTGTDVLSVTNQTSTASTPQNHQISGVSSGDVSIGSGSAGGVVLDTAATKGFLRIPQMAGAPSGTPAITDNFVPIVWDSTNKKLHVYSGGSWVASGAFT